ncbi:metal ABC transporter ATPase [Streptomyces sp. CNQ-509]|uniref:STAS domain-containing protein n=1 Tax=unclassified Streptomyces TaxID=2593676 RepID=UPI00062E0C52|nr:STAS domain-containing protein [Streptomyces sp. CNQ-509]AKH82983.1 metal ABC transporter ATPase [Streptomyces sp. CNQ-509]
MLQVTTDNRGDWYVLWVCGELDLVTSPRVRQRVHDAVAEGRRRLVLDLSAVRFCDSSGVGVLIAARRLLSSCGGEFRLILPADGGVGASGGVSGTAVSGGAHVNRVLAALGVRRLFAVYADVDDATSGTAEPLSA